MGGTLTKYYPKIHWGRTNLSQQKSLLHFPTSSTKCALSGRLAPSSYISNKLNGPEKKISKNKNAVRKEGEPSEMAQEVKALA